MNKFSIVLLMFLSFVACDGIKAEEKPSQLQSEIISVLPNSQAFNVGLQVKDVLVSYNGKKITTRVSITDEQSVCFRQKNENITLVVERQGRKVKFVVKYGKLGIVIAGRFPGGRIDIVGQDLDGESFSLSDYRGNVVMLVFWGDW
jgi:hypothetical protein